MTFAEHVEAHRLEDGTYDIRAAEEARAQELLTTAGEELARRAAHDERRTWEKSQRERSLKAMTQPTIAEADTLEIHLAIGKGRSSTIGDMNVDRLRMAKDITSTNFGRQSVAFGKRIEFYDHHLRVLGPNETIREFYTR